MQAFEFCCIKEDDDQRPFAATLTHEGLIVSVAPKFGARKRKQDIPESRAYADLSSELVRQGWRRHHPSLWFSRATKNASAETYSYRGVWHDSAVDRDAKLKNSIDVAVYEVLSSGWTPVERSDGFGHVSEADVQVEQFMMALIREGWQQVPHQPAYFFKKVASESNVVAETPRIGGIQDPLLILKKLSELHASGVLTSEEFNMKKSEILARL